MVVRSISESRGDAAGRASGSVSPLLLLVEDDENYAALVQAMLSEAWPGMQVAHASSMAEAIALLVEVWPSCALLDLGLPDSTGAATLERLQAAAPGLPVVVLTGDDSESRALDLVGLGAHDYLTKGETDGRMLRRSILYAVERQHAEDRLHHADRHDRLTGLPNQVLLNERLNAELRLTPQAGRCLAVLVIGLDRFRHVNEAYGHLIGDEILRAAAERLSALTPPGDTVARYGSDVFVMVLANLPDASGALERGHAVGEALAEPFDVDGRHVHLSSSMGITTTDAYDTDPEALVREATAAMHRAKDRPGTTLKRYDEHMRLGARRGIEIVAGLHRALAQHALEVHYQPLVDVGSGALEGFEALARWPAGQAAASPEVFIPAAERSGMIIELGDWVLDQACTTLACWDRGPAAPPLSMHVNVSGVQLVHGDFPRRLARVLRSTGVDPPSVTLELTESTLVRGDARIASALRELRETGVRLSMDDFGTGFAALATLVELDFDEVKIDRIFLTQQDRPGSLVILQSSVALARELGLDCICEGVETAAQRAVLLAAGARKAQGELFGRARPAAELAQWLQPDFRF